MDEVNKILDELKAKLDEVKGKIDPFLADLDADIRAGIVKFLDEAEDFWQSVADKIDVGGDKDGTVEYDYPDDDKGGRGRE